MRRWTFEPYVLETDSDLDPGIWGGPLFGIRPIWLENERGLELYLGGLFIGLTWLRKYDGFDEWVERYGI